MLYCVVHKRGKVYKRNIDQMKKFEKAHTYKYIELFIAISI